MQRREFITLFGGTAATWPLAARAQQPAKMKRIAFVNPAGKVSEISVSGRPHIPRFFRGAKSPWLRRGPKPRGGTVLWRRATRTLCRTGPRCRQHASRLDFSGGRSSIVRLQNGDDDNPDCDDNHRSDCNGTCGKYRAAGRQHHRRYYLCEDWKSLENVWGCWSRRCQNCPPSVTLYRDHSGKIQEVRQRERRPNGQAFRCRLLCWALLTRQSTSASSDRWNKIERMRSWYLMKPEHTPIVRRLSNWPRKAGFPQFIRSANYVEVGGLMAYSIDLADIFRRVANLIDKILRGANPGDIPFYRSTQFELIINLKTAKALGLEMPAMLLGRADEVIE